MVQPPVALYKLVALLPPTLMKKMLHLFSHAQCLLAPWLFYTCTYNVHFSSPFFLVSLLTWVDEGRSTTLVLK